MKQKLLLALSMASSITAFAQTNPPVMQIERGSDRLPALVKWSSSTAGVYRIEYSVNLTNWFVADSDIPTQGSNTFWVDMGTTSATAPRTPSIDPAAPYRFYKVSLQRYMSNAVSVSVIISNVSSGAVLSEVTNIYASATSTNGVSSARLFVDGEPVILASDDSYDLPLETRVYPNGTHRISVIAEDKVGIFEGGEVSGGDRTSNFGQANATVTFSNFLSSVRVRYGAYRPDLGQTQQVYGTWSSPRLWQVDFTAKDNTNTVYRSFTGEGSRIVVTWDGLNSAGQQIPAQMLDAVIYDLGEGTEPAPESGGGSTNGPPSFNSASQAQQGADETPWYPKTFSEALATGWSSFFVAPPPMPPVKVDGQWFSWEMVFGFLPLQEVQIPLKLKESFVAKSSAQSFDTASSSSAAAAAAASGFVFKYPFAHKTFGTAGIFWQGHHPKFFPNNRPPRGAPFGQVTFSSSVNPPWDKIANASRIGESLGRGFPAMAYPAIVVKGDDNCTPADLYKSSLGGNGAFNSANISIYIGHSGAAKENIVALGHSQSFIPIYNSSAGTITWVGMNDMRLGSSNLKWAAFYSCNLFRDSPRANPIYTSMKNANHLAMTSSLHIMQAYATEMSVHPDFAIHWPTALHGGTGVAANHTVLGAWRYACIRTQPKESAADANISRSIYWEECGNDFIYGYGTQTDPSPDHVQGELLENDQTAPTL